MEVIMVCSKCGKRNSYKASGTLDDTNNALRKARKFGWLVGETGSEDVCPSCYASMNPQLERTKQ